MSSETTELTFVRCPSCRSLVPATATRCRICNNPLEGGGKIDDSDTARAAARIRQKTISASADEVTSALAEVKGDYAGNPVTQQPPAAPEPISDAAPSEDVDVDFDPLGAYLQELEEAEELAAGESVAPAQEAITAAAINKELDDDELDPLGLDIFDELDDEPEPKPMAAPPPPAPSRAEAEPVIVSAAPVFEPPVEIAREPEPVRAAKPMDPPVSKPPQGDRRPLGMAPQGGRLGGSSDVPRPENRHADRRPHEPKQRDEHQHEQRRTKEGQQQRPNQPTNQHNGQQGKRDARGEARPDTRHDAPKGKQGGHEPRPEQQRGEGRTPEHSSATAQRPAKMNAGKLFGWFVSYENPDGRAIELREGKCFITGNSIRATDLVIEDSSISTPHALMSISGDAGLKVQDLMSERGLFVRSRDGGQYRREDGTLELKHGDWVRFGDVEFLITLVPTGTRK